jgi:hypothetical protein
MFFQNGFNGGLYGYHIDYSLVAFPEAISMLPGFAVAFGDSVILNQYPIFKDTNAYDFNILKCSPAVNKGNDTFVFLANLSADLDGNTRIQNGRVDLGAYEISDNCSVPVIDIMNDGADIQLTISPNPATNTTLLEWNEGLVVQNIQIVDALGKTIRFFSVAQEQHQYIVDLNGLGTGIYIISLLGADNAHLTTERLVVSH